MSNNNNQRPVFLNLFQIRLPVTGVASIAHRISGAILLLLVPLLLYGLQLSLRSPEDFARVTGWLDQTWVRLAAIPVIWALAHHFFAGIRFLLMDLDCGLNVNTARVSAWLVLAAGAVTALVAAGWLL